MNFCDNLNRYMRPWGYAVTCCLGSRVDPKASSGCSIMSNVFENRFRVVEGLSQGLLWPVVSFFVISIWKHLMKNHLLAQNNKNPIILASFRICFYLGRWSWTSWASCKSRRAQVEVQSCRHHESTQTKPAFSFVFQPLSLWTSLSKFLAHVVYLHLICCQLPLHTLDHFFFAPSNVHVMK